MCHLRIRECRTRAPQLSPPPSHFSTLSSQIRKGSSGQCRTWASSHWKSVTGTGIQASYLAASCVFPPVHTFARVLTFHTRVNFRFMNLLNLSAMKEWTMQTVGLGAEERGTQTWLLIGQVAKLLSDRKLRFWVILSLPAGHSFMLCQVLSSLFFDCCTDG